jgi:hypothetical protein
MAEKFYHVIGAVGDPKVEMLFSDLTLKELISDFVTPYKRGETFFAGARVVAPSELRLVRIVQTTVPEAGARGKINHDDLAHIAEINRTSGIYLRGGPGSSVGLLGLSKQAIGWTLGIVAAVIATGAANLLGWA